jgi:hypothetical protein
LLRCHGKWDPFQSYSKCYVFLVCPTARDYIALFKFCVGVGGGKRIAIGVGQYEDLECGYFLLEALSIHIVLLINC